MTDLPLEVLQEFEVLNSNKEGITFIIPFRGPGRQLHITKCIDNLILRYPGCEILIIEDGSNQTITRNIQQTRYVFIYSKRLFNKCLCFNLGFLIANNNIICGLDCDMLIPSTLLQNNLQFVNDNKIVFPGNDIYQISHLVNVSNLHEKIWLGGLWSKDSPEVQFHGGIFLCNKKAYVNIGGFDERFEGYGYEDTNFYAKARETLTAKCSLNMTLLHIDHNHEPKEQKNLKRNEEIANLFSWSNPKERIEDCKKYNIFRKQ